MKSAVAGNQPNSKSQVRQLKANKPDITEILSRIQSLEQQNEMLVEQIKQQDTIIKKQAEKIAELLNSKAQIDEKHKEIEDNESHNKPTILFDTSSIVSIDCDELEEDDMRDLQHLHHIAHFIDKEEQKHIQFTDDGDGNTDYKQDPLKADQNAANGNLKNKVGATIANCFNQQKIKLVNVGIYNNKRNNNFNLRSPRLLQNKIAGKPSAPAENALNKFIDFKSTTEGSCVDENKKPKGCNTIMDNYLLGGNNSVQSGSFIGGTQGFVPFANNKNNTICGMQFNQVNSKRKRNKISVLNLSLIGSMMIKSQQSNNQSKDQ